MRPWPLSKKWPTSCRPAPASGGLPSDFWYWISAPPAMPETPSDGRPDGPRVGVGEGVAGEELVEVEVQEEEGVRGERERAVLERELEPRERAACARPTAHPRD